MYKSVVLFYREVDGLVAATPPEPFLPQEKPGRLVCSPHAGSDFENTIATSETVIDVSLLHTAKQKHLELSSLVVVLQ